MHVEAVEFSAVSAGAIPNHEHGRIDEDDDTEEEALDGDNDVAAS